MTVDDARTLGPDVKNGAGQVDFVRLTAEIDDEVRRRRAAGDFPPGLERELDAMFRRYAPAGTATTYAEAIDNAEAMSFIHAEAPTTSRRLGLGQVKKVLRRLMAWYIRFLAQQVTTFAAAVSRAVRLLGQRVDDLERAAGTGAARALEGRPLPEPDLGEWLDVVSTAFVGCDGRVLHTASGGAELLARLVADGRDAYGVEPREALALRSVTAGLDVRADEPLDHLRRLPSAALGGLALSGFLDAAPIGVLLELVELAADRIGPGGTLVVTSLGPGTWAAHPDVVATDLAPGRPLHAETLAHLVRHAGFTDITVHRRPADPPLEPVNIDDLHAGLLNTLVAAYNHQIDAGPYTIVARRPA